MTQIADAVALDARDANLHRVSWGAVLAGALAALLAQLVLNMIGLGLGVATLDPGTSDNPSAGAFSIGAAIWTIVACLVAAGFGGYIAGNLSGKTSRMIAGWHGLVAFALSTLFVIYLLTSAVGGLMGGAFGLVTSAVGGAGKLAGGAAQTAAQAAAPSLARGFDPFSTIEQQLRSSTGGQDPAALRDVAIGAVRAAISGDPAQQAQARDRAAQAIAQAQNIPVDQARQQVAGYEAQYKQTVDDARAKAVEAAKTTASAVSKASLYGALTIILGALAAVWAARAGAARRVHANVTRF